ncbi:MAG: TonB family protein, partial [Gammaproteobacteria bacterium]
MRTKLLPALGIAGLLAGCASSPSVPYWQNSRWINALATKIENQLVYPIEATKAGFPSGQAIVQFTYDNGRLTDVFIAKSTGNYILDSAITTQIAQIKPPILPGSEIAVPRQFRLPIALSIANSTFF